MRGYESQLFQNISASTSPFLLKGGQYAAAVVATFGGGSVKLQKIGPDGSTYVSVAAGTDFTAAGMATVYLPPGNYRFTVATATAVYAEIVRIPAE